MQDWKLQDWNVTDKVAEVKFTRLENGGLEFGRLGKDIEFVC